MYLLPEIYSKDSKVITTENEQDNKFTYYFGFNEKKKFIIRFHFFTIGNDFGSIIYYVDYKGEIDIPLTKPNIYNDNIILIDSIFVQLKMGKETTLKFKSDVTEEIMVKNSVTQYFKKNKN